MAPLTTYLQRIRACVPDLPLASVQPNQDGLVNDVLIVNDAWVFRFPRNDQWAKTLLAHEIKVVTLLHRYVAVPIPDFHYQGADFVAYPLLPGRPLHRHDLLALEEPAQERLTEQLATFLRQLHTVPRAELERAGIAPSDVNRSPAVWAQLFEEVQRELFPLMMAHTRAWVCHHFAPVLRDPTWLQYEPRLIHGDLASYHLLYEPTSAQISGIIDFGTAGIGDPAADVACLLYQYGEGVVQRIATCYPELGQSLDRARFWAGTLELQWALKGLRSHDASWFLVHIGSARDVRPLRGDGV